MTESLRLMRDKHVTQSKVQYRNWNFESVTTESYKSFNTGINLLAALHVSARLAQSRATSTHVLNMPSVKTAQDMGCMGISLCVACSASLPAACGCEGIAG